MKRINLHVTDELDDIADKLAEKLAVKTKMKVSKADTFRMGVLALAKKEKVSA